MQRTTWRGWLVASVLAVLLLGVGGRTWHGGASAALRGYPPLPADAGTHRLLTLPETGLSSSYRFLATLPSGAPVSYDPCRPIHYVIRSAHLPAYGAQMIQQAVAEVSAATGLKFVDDGRTAEPLVARRPDVQPRYGKRWAPVLIAFSDATESPDLAGAVMGRGGSVSVSPDGPGSARYVTGDIRLDQADFDRALREVNGWERDRAAVMHELGHVVGLDHVQDQLQVMYPDNIGVLGYGAGDLRGLALEGSGLCHHDT